jgi:hypothetical protein
MRKINKTELITEVRESRLKESCLIVNIEDYPLAMALTLDDYDGLNSCCKKFHDALGQIHLSGISNLTKWLKIFNEEDCPVKVVRITFKDSTKFVLVSSKWLQTLEELHKNAPRSSD